MRRHRAQGRRAARSPCPHGDLRFGKRPTSISEKPDDRWAIPLWHGLHVGDKAAQHSSGEKLWWDRRGINPLPVALTLYVHYLWFGAAHNQGARHIRAAWRPD